MNNPTIEELNRLFRLDVETGKLYRRIRTSNNHSVGDEVGSVNGKGYLQVQIGKHKLQIHRVVFAMVNNAWPAGEVDHVNCNRADNRPSNLREASRSQNCRNRGAMSNSKTNIKGVHWHKAAGKWVAAIRAGGKKVHLGVFADIEQAKAAYAAASNSLHGDFGRIE